MLRKNSIQQSLFLLTLLSEEKIDASVDSRGPILLHMFYM